MSSTIPSGVPKSSLPSKILSISAVAFFLQESIGRDLYMNERALADATTFWVMEPEAASVFQSLTMLETDVHALAFGESLLALQRFRGHILKEVDACL